MNVRENKIYSIRRGIGMTKCKKTRDFLKTNIVDIIGIFVAIVGIVVAIIIGWKTCEI